MNGKVAEKSTEVSFSPIPFQTKSIFFCFPDTNTLYSSATEAK